MITLFNRREVRITRSLEEEAKISGALQNAGIETRVLTNSMTNLGRYRGGIGINPDFAYEYRIYVKKSDYEMAKYVLTQM